MAAEQVHSVLVEHLLLESLSAVLGFNITTFGTAPKFFGLQPITKKTAQRVFCWSLIAAQRQDEATWNSRLKCVFASITCYFLSKKLYSHPLNRCNKAHTTNFEW